MNVELSVDLLKEAISTLNAFSFGHATVKRTIDKLNAAAIKAHLNCPFCGHKGISFLETVCRGQGVLKCDMCGATGPERDSLEKATLEWNTRVAEKQD